MRYPVYVISKGRADCCLTARFLTEDEVPFRLVIEPQERGQYREHLPNADLADLPFSDLGQGSIPARNWVWRDALRRGAERHWILDDNIDCIKRRYHGYRIRCPAGPALAAAEDFIDRYENVGIAGLAYVMFAGRGMGRSRLPPFYLNVHVYSCLLIDTALKQRWRGRYNEDTDLCLQVLSAGLCTVLINAFLIRKRNTMTMKGGNTQDLYVGDGRLRMARSLERMWPGIVETKRRFQRPQHVVKNAWKNFTTPLIRKPGLEIPAEPNEYGMKLRQVKPIKSPAIRKLLEETLAAEIDSEPDPP